MARGLIEIDEARARVLAEVESLPAEPVSLDRLAGRVLAEPVTTAVPLPGFDNSAMDGFAIRAADLEGAGPESPVTLRVIDESRAGHPARVELEPGQAIAISTGAAMPAGADAVVRVEVTERRGDEVEVSDAVAIGTNVRREGEDVGAGAEVLRPGTVLGAAEVGVLAAAGRAEAHCAREPRLALVSTGDELVPPGGSLGLGSIYESNSAALAVLARAAGARVVDEVVVADDRDATEAALETAIADTDVLVVCGGVSVGEHDHVRPALAELAVEQRFWGVSLRPGKPTYFGVLESGGGKKLVFGLPGNPVSAIVTFALFVRPALLAMQGADPALARVEARMAVDYETARGRGEAIRVRLNADDRGWRATPTGAQGSHVLTSMLGADGLAIAPSGTDVLAAGERVEVELLGAAMLPRGSSAMDM